MKYSLRSLMIVALVGPPLLAGVWFAWESVRWRFETPRGGISLDLATEFRGHQHIIPATPEGRKAATEEWRRRDAAWRRSKGLSVSPPNIDDKP